MGSHGVTGDGHTLAGQAGAGDATEFKVLRGGVGGIGADAYFGGADGDGEPLVAAAEAEAQPRPGLRELRAQGEIDNISLGMCVSPDRNGPGDSNADLILELIRGAPDGTFNSAMLAYGWNLHNQAALPVMLECQRRGIEVHAAGVFWFNGYGVLFDPSLAPDTEEGEATLAKRSAWLALAEKHGVSLVIQGRRLLVWLSTMRL